MSTNNASLKEAGYERDQVVEIINSVIDKVQSANFLSKEALSKELHGLKDVIDEARQDIGSARPNDIKGVHIPTATDELDAVVGATEEASGLIMDSCEVIQGNLDKMDSSVSQAVEAEVTKIFEACSFQDITGQRISKVITTLKTIDEKVSMILDVLEQKMPGIEAENDSGEGHSDDEALLNGPQMPEKAITQDDIDKLLSDFDN